MKTGTGPTHQIVWEGLDTIQRPTNTASDTETYRVLPTFKPPLIRSFSTIPTQGTSMLKLRGSDFGYLVFPSAILPSLLPSDFQL